ncbi:autotransporter domain-containing protein [Niveispirillum sp. KHB5.9]|uniref:autotransporter family protein n=1 Tax=Niveispirillum sp. KHB5.9 TaxID=3400269 RepID=UPI003A87FBFE
MNGFTCRPAAIASIKAALLMTVVIPVATLKADAATCNGTALLCNGDFESLSMETGSDAASFAYWTSSDPAGLRAGTGSNGAGHSAEFLFSTNTLSQAVTTGVGARYNVTFQYKSEGGQGLTAYFGDAKIFDYIGDSAPPTDWVTYSFNVQAFSGESILRFVADSLGAAQNIDNVVVTLCPTCTPNVSGNLGAVIDKNQAFYTTDDAAGAGTNLSGTRTLTFDGGTLRPGSPGALGTQPDKPVSLALHVGVAGGTLDNAGQNIALSGSIINTASAATPFTFAGTGQGTLTNNITNLGAIVVTTSGRTLFSGAIANTGGSFAVRSGGQANITGGLTGGTVQVENGGLYVNSVVTAPITVSAQGTLRGNGRIVGPTTIAGTLRPGNSPGTLNFQGPVTLQTNSAFVVEIDGPGTANGAGNYSRAIVTGAGNTFTIGTGVTLTPVLRGLTYSPEEVQGTNSYNLTLGQRLAGVVQAEGGVVGTFASIAQPTAGLPAGSRIMALYSANAVDLYVGPASYRGLAGLTINQAAAGAAVDALEAARNPGVTPVLNALLPLGISALPATLGAISGEFNANLPLAAVDVSRGFGSMITTRQGGLHDGGQGWNVWGRAFGNKARTSSDGNNPGFRHRVAGGLAGIDYGMSNDALRVGVAAGYADSRVTGRNDSGRASIDSYYIGNYLGWTQDALFVDAQVGVTFSDYETRRAITIGTQTRTASGKTDGKTIGAGIEAGYRLDLGGAILTPSAFLRYDGSDADAFAETGADAFNLSVDSDKHADLRGGFGVRFTHPVALDGGGTLVPELSARWEHDLSKPGYRTSQALLGQSFTIFAAEPGRDTAVLGGGLTMEIADNMRVSARYDAELSDNRTQHALTAQVRFAW